MTILQIKAFVYRHTGINLTHREQCAFIDSEAYWIKWQQTYSPTISLRNIHGLIIGGWQADNGITRRMRKLGWFGRWRRNRRFKRIHAKYRREQLVHQANHQHKP